MPNCKSFLVTEAEWKHVRRRARFQQNRDASCHQDFFFMQGKSSKEIEFVCKLLLQTNRGGLRDESELNNILISRSNFEGNNLNQPYDSGRIPTYTTVNIEHILCFNTWKH